MLFIELQDQENEFYQKYMRSFAARSACSSSLIEAEDSQDMDDVNLSLAISNYMDAFDYLFHLEDKKLTPYSLPEINSKMTGGAYDRFRSRAIIVEGSNQLRSEARNIPMELYVLFDNYYNIWSYLEDPYLREAKFHIQFLMIHPFGDGNGRCARLLTSYHLAHQGIPPIIITKEKKKEYCDCIEARDEEKLARMFEESSKKELQVMLGIYNTCKIDYDSLENRIYQKKRKN